MKNKNIITILIMLILFLLIGCVSANEINTTEEISVSTTDDVSSTVNVDSTDEKYEHDLTDESEDSNVLSISADENSTSMKDNDESSISNDVSHKSISNSQILGMNNDNNILGDSSTTMSLEFNSTSIKIIYNNLASTRSGSNTLNIEYILKGRTYSKSISVSNPTSVYDGGKTFYLFSGEYTISNVNLMVGSEVEVYLQLRNNPSDYGVYMGSISLSKTVDLDVVINDQTFNYNSNGYQITGYASLFGEGITSDNTYFVYIDNTEYFVNSIGTTHYFSNGNFTIYIPNGYITLGSNTLYIFTKSTYYGPAVGSFTLTITKVTPSVSVSSASINYNTGTYSVSGTCSGNGLTINLKAGSPSLGSATVSNGKWTVSGISSTKLNPGSYTLTATSTETDTYGSASATNTLTVSKSTPTVTVTDKNVNYNTGTYTLGGTVKVGSNNVGTGTVTIYKDGVQIGTASVSGGSWTSSAISSTSYDADSYTITASYASNTYYNANSGTGTLTISKVTPTITVSTAPDIKYGNGVYTVSGTAKYGSNNVDMGTITLKCGDTVLGTCSVSGGLWTVSNIDTTLVDPSPNPYTITAYYENNVNYNAASATNSLTVNKFTPDINIDPVNIWYNQSNGGVLSGRVHTYNGDFYSGFIDLYVNGELIASDVSVSSAGIWSYTLSSTTNLSPGTYSVGVDWKGNEYANNNTLTDNKYTVNKGMVIPLITSTGNIDIGRSEYVYVDVNNIMGGGYLSGMTVILQGSGIDGILQEISDVNGRATFTVANLVAGKYDDWKISVASDDYYYPTMENFNVAKFYVQYPLTVNITSISPNYSTYPDEIIVTGFTDADQIPQGNVSLTIGDKTYTGFFNSTGNFTASLIGVKPGTYTNITAKYNPTEEEFYYRGVEGTVSIQETIINKYLPDVVFDSVNIDFGSYPGNATITGHITYVNNQIPTGRVEVIYNGKVYGNSTLNDAGEFTIAATDLPRGEYNLTIKYLGDDYYLNNTNTTSNIIINPSEVNFTITVNNATYNVGETSTTIDVILTGLYGGNDIAKGIVRLEVGDKHWDAALDNTGKATIEINSLNAGDYTNAVLKYIISNDEQSYKNTSTGVDFSIYKADPGLGVRAPTIGAGKDGSIYITLHDNTTGELILTVGTSVRVTLNITGGANRTYVINQPPVGANQVIANYTGDVNFNSSLAETMLYIERPESYLNYTVTNITYGQSEDLEFKIYLDEELTKLASNATGTIRVYGLDKNYGVDVVGGLGYLSVPNLTKGNWTVVAIYSGNDELGGSDKENKFTVTGVVSPLSIAVNNNSITAGDDIIVTVTLNNTINEPVQLFVDNRLYYTNTTVNGVVSFVLRNLTYGNHNISAVFNGNAGFESANNNTTVIVNRINVNPNINITYNRDILFNISVPDETTGYIKIKGNGTDESVLIDNCEAILTLDKVTRGNYKFNISYDGNWKYLPFNIEKTFTVDKVDDYMLNITSTDAVFNRTVDINVTAFSDLEGKTINLTVDGTTKAVATVVNGVATFNNVYLVSNTSGEFEIIASYAGDNIYEAKSFTITVPIVPTDDYVLGLKALDLVHVGDNVLINITAPELITSLNITINGKTQLITRNNFTYHMNDIDEGEYTVSISYAGDNAYESKSNSTTFNVIKKDSSILIKVDNTHYGEDAIINISVTDGATGYVLVTIDNKTSKYDLTGNSTQIISKEYAQGLHNINVSYVGDRKYNPSNNVSSFTVFKAFSYNMTVYENETLIENNSVLHKFVDHTLVVDVALPDDATGNLTFILYDNDNNKVSNWTVTLPKNLINYELRDVTNYTLEITYGGDSNYESKLFKFEIDVHKFLIDANATFIDNPYFVLSDSKINISSNLNDRQLRVYIDGVYYSLTDVITNNKTVFNLGKLSAGNHTISLMYNGDVYYTSLFTSHNITVSKLNSSVNITATSVRTGNPVIVDVNASGNGSANIIIFNSSSILGSYNITINNGKGSFIVPVDFVDGSYNVNITYYGDDVYYGSSNVTSFVVSDRIVSTLDIAKPIFIVNRPSVINVSTNFPDGVVEIYVDGVKQNSITITNRKGTISLAGLSAGNHTILASFAGDYNYTDLTKSFDIFVEKLNSTVNITASSVRTGNPVIVNVNASGNGSANIIIFNSSSILGSYNITINNGKGSFIVPVDFVDGSYNVNITYYGDDVYYGSSNVTSFVVSDRIVSTLDIAKPIFIVNRPSVINVSTNFPNGVVEIYVDGVKQNNITITNRKGTISLSGLSSGNHTILASFAGDYNYTDLTKSFDIFVEKLNSTVNVTATSVRTGNPVIVDVNASGSGLANIVIFNATAVLANYNITVTDGRGSFIVPVDFVEGSYNVNVTYYGDNVYYGNANATSFTVSDRIVSEMNFTKPVFTVNEPSAVDVKSNFPEGVIEVYVDGVKQDNVTIFDGECTIYLAGLSAGNHTVLVSFAGDYNYTDLTTSFDIFVEKLNSTVNVAATNVRTGNPVIINVTASGNGSANIVIFNGTGVLGSYNITVNDGEGSFIVPVDFVEGRYSVNVTYYGDDIYYGNANTTSFIVSDRIISEMNFTKPVFVVNRPSVINVSSNFPNGVVEIYVDGVKQNNITVTNRKGTINLAGLSAGNHTVLVSFAGDYNYTDLVTSFDIFVEKLNSTVNVTASSVRTGNPVIVDVNASGNGSANIVIFNDTDVLGSYNITVNDGKGSFIVPIDFINGTYNLNVTYYGDDIYYESSNMTVFNVFDRINSTLNIDKFSFTVNTPDVITVSSNFPHGDVNVYIDGNKMDDITIADFKSKIYLDPLSVGNHTLLLIYHGDYDYTNLTVSFNLSVFKLNSTVNVSATNVRTGNHVIISINASGDGIANIVIFNESEIIGSFNTTIDNGQGSFIVPYTFSDGSYLVNVTYFGDDTYYGSHGVTDFIVSDKIFSTLSLDKHDVIVNTPDVITVHSNFASGVVSVYVDGKRQDDINIVNNQSMIYLDALTVGEHNILLMYSGDYNFSSLTTSFNIIANRFNSTVKVTGDDVLIYNNSIALDIVLNNTSTDARIPDAFVDVTVYYINGSVAYNNSNVNFVNEAVEHVVSNLMAGDYYVIVTYPGNENFTGNVSERFDFSIIKASTSVVANINDSTFNDAVKVEYAIVNNDNTGAVISHENVDIKVYDKSGNMVYNTSRASFNDMHGIFDITDYEFGVGNYTVNITYDGNENFTGSYAIITFEVFKARTAVFVNVDNTTYNQSVIVEFNLANINGTGAHIPNSNVEINVIDKKTGNTVYTNNSLFDNENGILNITDFEFAAGNYSVNVIYDGNENFAGNSTLFDFTVSKARTGVSVSVNDTTFNQNVIVSYNLSNINGTAAHIPDGKVTINITDKRTGRDVYYKSGVDFINEKGTFEISDFVLAAGDYSVNVTYAGSENFIGSSAKFNFTVSKARSNVTVGVANSTFNQTVVVDYSIANINGTNAHVQGGKVTIKVIRKETGRTVYNNVSTFDNENGVLRITDHEFGAGNYIINVTYAGDENFTGNSTKLDFTVSKARTHVVVNVDNTTFNQTVIINYNLTNINATTAHIPNGKVTINITDKATGRIIYSNKDCSFTNEAGVLTINNYEFAAGNYSVVVGYAGSENFVGNSTTFDFTVAKARTNVSVNVDNITFNQNVIINYNLSNIDATDAHIPNSNVMINIVDKKTGNDVYNKKAYFTDEKGIFEISDFEFVAGNYSVNVTYEGNENFIGNSTKFDFTVFKAHTNVSVNVNNVTFNQAVGIYYNLSNIDETNANIPNSKVLISITDKSTNNVVYTKNSSFVKEKGSYIISDFEFAAGNYSVNVIYDGNENFTGNSTKFDFTVFKAHAGISANANYITFNQTVVIDYTLSNINATAAHIPDGKVTINITDNATGRIVYSNSNCLFSGEKGVLTINNREFAAGNYSVSVTYGGNENFVGNSTAFNFTIFKACTSVSASVNDTIFNQTVIIGYNLSNADVSDAHIPNGEVTINITNKETGNNVYNTVSTFNNEKGVLNIGNFVFAAGNYTVTVTYAGNENFTGSSINVSFKVSKARTSVSANANSTTYNQRVVVEYNLTNIDGTSVNIPNDNVIINITTVNNRKVIYSNAASFANDKGVLSIGDYEFGAGNYSVTVIYIGNENFTGSSAKFNFTVFKARTAVSVNVNNITFNQSVVVEYNLSNINGTDAHIPDANVAVSIVNKDTGVNVYSNNRASFAGESGSLPITDLVFGAGNYSVNVSYGGNANFTTSSAVFDFTVSKARTSISVNVNNTTFNQNVVVEYNLSNINSTDAHIPNSNVVVTVVNKENGDSVYNNTVLFTREKGTLNIKNYEFAAGNYSVNVTYEGNANFMGSSTVFDFTVSKARSNISVNVNNVTFNQNVIVEYALNNINGTNAHIPDTNVVITIINKESNVPVYYNTTAPVTLESGVLNINDYEFAAGNYSVNVTYDGSDNFMGSSTLADFTVYKARSDISVNVNSTTFNDSVVVEYILNSVNVAVNIPDANVAVSIVNKTTGVKVYDGVSSFVDEKGILNITDFEFAAGNYSVNVTYGGSDNFMGSSNLFDFTVYKAHTAIVSNASSVIFNNDVTFNVSVININNTAAILNNNIEMVSVDIIGDNGYSYSNVSSISDANRVFTNLGAGKYSVTVKYNGGGNFLASDDAVFDFIVSPANTSSSVNVDNVIYDNHAVVRGDVYNQNTPAVIQNDDYVNISIYNNGKVVYTGNITVGDLRSGYVLPLLDAGNYNLAAHYYTRENFSESISWTEFNVSKANSMIQFNDDYVIMGNNLTFNVVNITDGRSITLKVNNKSYMGNVVDGVGYILIENAESGTFDNVLVTFDGDTNYNPSNDSNTVKFIRSDSFTALQFLIDNNTNGSLVLNNSYVFDPKTDDVNGVNVNKSINITGNGSVIDANGISSIFNVTGDGVNISDVSFVNANASNNSSVVSWSGDNGSINNVGFSNNTVDGGNVLDISGNNLDVNNSSFTNNSGVNGDIINMANVENTTISNSSFNVNDIVNGNIISVADSDGTNMSNVTFKGNDISNGTVIDVANSNGTDISDASFTGNDVNSNSSVVTVSNSDSTTVTNNNFTDNHVSGNSSVVDIDNSDDVNLTNVIFNNDTASDNSSIVLISNSSDVVFDDIVINSSSVDGDNCIVEIVNSDVNSSNINFTNDAADKGRMIDIDSDSNVYLNNVSNSNNSNNNHNNDFSYSASASIASSDIYVGDAAVVNATVTSSYPYEINGIMVVKVNDKEYYFTLSNGSGSVSIAELKEGTYNITGIYLGNEYIDVVHADMISINVIKVSDFDMFISKTNITTSEGLVIVLPDDASGKVNVTIDNQSFVASVKNGKAVIAGDNLPLGYSIINAYYSGDDKYVSKDLSEKISVKSDNYPIVIEDKDLIYGDDLVIILPEAISGNVTVNLGNKSINANPVNGRIIVSGDKLSLGFNNVDVIVSGDDKFAGKTLSDVVRVKSDNYTFDLEDNAIIRGDDLVIVLPDDASGNVTIAIDNESFTVPVVDGKVSLSTESVSMGDYNISISYSGDDCYVPRTISANISVISSLVVSAPEVVKYYGGSERFVVSVTDLLGSPVSGQSVVICLNNLNYTRNTGDSGNVSLALNLLSGEYPVVVIVGNETYYSSVTVKATIVGDDLVKVYKNDSQYYVVAYDSEGNYLNPGDIVNFNINGVFYNRSVGADNRVKLNINLPAGEYIITAINLVTGEMCSNNITVLSRIINNNDVVKYYKNDTQYYVTVIGDDGNPVGAGVDVVFNINGVFYTRQTNASGVAKLNINLPPNTYTTVTTEYKECKISNTIQVLSTLNADDVVVKYGSHGQFVVTVLDDQGNLYPNQTVKFNINGVFYDRVTDGNGQARLNINLPRGEYIITSTYNGLNVANKITVTD